MEITRKEYEFVENFWQALRYLSVESFPVSDSSFSKGVEAMVAEYRKNHSREKISVIDVHLLHQYSDGEYHIFEDTLADLRDVYSTYVRDMNNGEKRVFIDKPNPFMPKPDHLDLAIAFCEGSGTAYDQSRTIEHVIK